MTSIRNHRCERASHFVPFGNTQLAEAIRVEVLPDIQIAVQAEYVERINAAGFFKRIWLRWQIGAEIRRRIELEITEQMPSDRALY